MSVAEQAGLGITWWETPKTCFFAAAHMIIDDVITVTFESNMSRDM